MFRGMGRPTHQHGGARPAEDRQHHPAGEQLQRAPAVGEQPAPQVQHPRHAMLEEQAEDAATARAGNRRFGRLSTLRAHTNAPCETDSRWETLREA